MKYLFKLGFAIILLITPQNFGQVSNNFEKVIKNNSENISYSGRGNNVYTVADSIAPDSSTMGNYSSVELSGKMVPGWNVGNSLEAIGGELAWGNPKITQLLIDSIKAAGFNSVRIPVAWSKFTDDSTFTIEQAWLNRVEEVVNYVLSNGMYAIINEHWDNGWIVPTYAMQEYVKNRLAKMWKQIAVHFRDYDYHLLFAGTNEVMKEGDYGTPKTEYYTVQNSYNQTFVNTIRSTGGKNFYRFLVVQGFNTNIDYTVKFFKIPTDVLTHRLMVEVHYYDPYNFTLNANSNVVQWGEESPNSETWANETYANGQFKKMKSNFVDKGYAVILGEYGVISRLNLGSEELNNDFAKYRRYYIEYITTSIIKHGLVPFYWDNGYTGNYSLGIFDRSTGAEVYPDIVHAIMAAVDSTLLNIGMGKFYLTPSRFSLFQNFPNPFNPTTNISYFLYQSSNVNLEIYDILGNRVEVIENSLYKPKGFYSINFNSKDFASGLYFYKLTANNFSDIKKMILLK
jgi:endoglucanase